MARDKNDETPFAGDVGALVVLLPRKLRDKSDDCDNEWVGGTGLSALVCGCVDCFPSSYQSITKIFF